MKFRTNTAIKRGGMKSRLLLQRILLVAATLIYAAVELQTQTHGAAYLLSPAFFALLIPASAIFALTFSKNEVMKLDLVPVLAALTYGTHTIYALTTFPNESSAYFSLAFTLLAFFIVTLSQRLRAAALALTAIFAMGAAANLIVLPAVISEFSPTLTLALWLSGFALAVLLAWILENERRKAIALGMELERRATSDNLTGVSNRAHINLLAQNEFSRARRYQEPYSCLILEIDEYESLVSSEGAHAINVVVQIFSGYCVVVMRHCDSFGRLSPRRFLALLPETKDDGALILANRVCKDIAALNVKAEGKSLTFTASIGAAGLHPADRWAGDLLRRAEQALEDAIERGGNNAVLAEPPIASLERVDETNQQDKTDRSL